MIANVLLQLAGLGFGIVCGGMVYEHITLIPKWAQKPPLSMAMFRGDYALRPELFWIPMHLVTLAFMIAGLAIGWSDVDRREPLIAALVTYVVILIVTNAWFVPELLKITRAKDGEIEPTSWRRRSRRWEVLSLIRGVFMLASGFLLMTAVTRG